MFSLQKFFCRDGKFFDLLDNLALSSTSSVKYLSEALLNPESLQNPDQFVQARRKSKALNDEISNQLCISFVTPLEREDIEALATALTKIAKSADKFVQHYLICRQSVCHEDFTRQAQLLEKSASTLLEMVKMLRNKPDVEKISEMNSQLRFFEGEADKILLTLLKDLYTQADTKGIVTVLVMKDLHGILEKLLDRFRDAGNIVFRTVLKYS